MGELGKRLKEAREEADITLASFALRSGYSEEHLGNVERGIRNVTPKVIKAYEEVLNRRSLLLGAMASLAVASAPDMAMDVFADISAESSRLLSQVQTSHATDRAIGALVARHNPCVASLAKWSRRGSPILRVNSVGILAKVTSPVLDNEVVVTLRSDQEVRDLYLTAVASRVLSMPWEDAGDLVARSGPLAEESHVALFATELTNAHDSGARWCSLLLLARTRLYDPGTVDPALHLALQHEPGREMLRSIGTVLAGLNPVNV